MIQANIYKNLSTQLWTEQTFKKNLPEINLIKGMPTI